LRGITQRGIVWTAEIARGWGGWERGREVKEREREREGVDEARSRGDFDLSSSHRCGITARHPVNSISPGHSIEHAAPAKVTKN